MNCIINLLTRKQLRRTLTKAIFEKSKKDEGKVRTLEVVME